jgi:hypothetical protein
VAIVTDGRMSGASGKGACGHPPDTEAAADGPISRLRDGDIIKLDARAGMLEVQVDAATLAQREPVKPEVFDTTYGVGANCSPGCARARRRRMKGLRSCEARCRPLLDGCAAARILRFYDCRNGSACASQHSISAAQRDVEY